MIKQTRILMGMPITVEISDASVSEKDIDLVYDYFRYVDEKFSTYKDTSEITRINKGLLVKNKYSEDMKTVLMLCEETKKLTNGYFDITNPAGIHDPSGLVKGWSIYNASRILKDRGFNNFYVDAGGDIQSSGVNSEGKPWTIGIQDPFSKDRRIIKVVSAPGKGVATSGTYIRGQHIYDPYNKKEKISDIVSLTVIGPNIYEADRFATAAFAMGKKGIEFIENLAGFEGYMIDSSGIATMTRGFEEYTKNNA